MNTADSRVELVWDAAASPTLAAAGEALRERVLTALEPRLRDGTVVVTASEHRGQLANRNAARARLQALLDTASAPPPPRRRPTRPTRGSVRRAGVAASQRRKVKAARRRPTTDD